MIIAVDGTAASGKGTLGRRLAHRFNLAYLDTGTLYRALALTLLRAGATKQSVDESDAARRAGELDAGYAELPENRREIRSDRVSDLASVVAAMPGVRRGFVDYQRAFAKAPPQGDGALLDGRDIGSVILPDADFKFFITAEIGVRADRRFRELQDAGESVMFRAVLEDMHVRDARDRERSASPLVVAEGAFEIDTSRLDADAVFEKAVGHITSTLEQS